MTSKLIYISVQMYGIEGSPFVDFLTYFCLYPAAVAQEAAQVQLGDETAPVSVEKPVNQIEITDTNGEVAEA